MENKYIKPIAVVLNLGLKDDITQGMGTMSQGAGDGSGEDYADGKGISGDVIDDEDDTKEPLQTGWSMD